MVHIFGRGFALGRPEPLFSRGIKICNGDMERSSGACKRWELAASLFHKSRDMLLPSICWILLSLSLLHFVTQLKNKGPGAHAPVYSIGAHKL